MASRFILPFADVGSGISPSDGAKLEFFDSGTSTQKDTFTDEALTTKNANPIISNGDGVFDETDIFLPDGGRYKVTLKDKNNVSIREADPVVGGVSSNLTAKDFDTSTAMIASTELNIGDIVQTAGRTAKGDGGDSIYEIVAAGTGTDDGGSFLDLTGITGQAKNLFSLSLVPFPQFDTRTNALAFIDGLTRSTLAPSDDAVEIIDDTAPLDYVGTKAAFVVQSRDPATLGASSFSPGVVLQFTSTGDGDVDSGSELSTSIWQGAFSSATKTGDGSQHCFTATGQLGVFGVGGYSELGLFQGEATNIGSELGTISGVEVLLKDSPDSGSTTFSTKMQAVVGRIAKFNPTVRKSFNFFASSEGTLGPNAILGGNTAGLKTWGRGIDFEGLIFSTGQAALFPNNVSLAWLDSASAAKTILSVNAADLTFLAAATATGKVALTNSAFSSRLEADDDAVDAILVFVGGSLKRVSQGAVDSGGSGFKLLRVPN